MEIEKNVEALLGELETGNGCGEKVTLVAATKTRTPEEINRAVRAGISVVAENRAQEFRDKYGKIQGAALHFIGHLQSNKPKYLVGKAELIQSVDREEIASALSLLASERGVVQDVLMQVNIGDEPTKGGYSYAEAYDAYFRLKERANLRPRGLFAMLPIEGDERRLGSLAEKMRSLFEKLRALDKNADFLSMGMSGDWRLCVKCGSNMIRLGTAIFGDRS